MTCYVTMLQAGALENMFPFTMFSSVSFITSGNYKMILCAAGFIKNSLDFFFLIYIYFKASKPVFMRTEK